ncbi:MAG: c-type cytochrome [Acidobacteria bacterium]|nr:c-type cytochrome [Acidobacteriota bacterium]
MSRRLLVVAAAAVLLAACSERADRPAEAPPQPASTNTWPAPEEARRRANPVAATPESVKNGAGLYVGYCLLCHGEGGRGDGPWVEKLPTPPADLTQPGLLDRQTDGEIFWKITKGREQMPGFETQLKEEQCWHLVNYLRALAKEPR